MSDEDVDQLIYDEEVEGMPLPTVSKPVAEVITGGTIVYETLKAPMLSSSDRKDLIAFRLNHDKYIRMIEEANRHNQAMTRATSFKSMMEPGFLETVCCWELGGISVTDTTDEMLKEWVWKQIEMDRSADATIIATMRSLKMDEKITSPGARVLNLMMQWDKIVRENGWVSVFQNTKGREQKIRYLTEAIRPKGLQNLIKNKIKLRMNEGLDNNPLKFFQMLKEKTIAWAQVEAYHEPTKGKAPMREARKRKSLGRPQMNTAMSCYKCGKQVHPVFKCPMKPSKDEIRKLLEKAKVNGTSKKNTNNTSKRFRSYTGVCRVGSERNQIEVKISKSNVLFPGIIDSGADYTLIPKKMALEAISMDPKLKLERLRTPIHLKLGDNETVASVMETIEVDLTLQTKAGELVTRKRNCLVWDVDSEEILLGNELLRDIGIDPQTALNELIRKLDSEEHTPQSSEFSSRDDQPDIGADAPEMVSQGIDNMLIRALKNGLPLEWREPLRKLVLKHSSVWKLQLGPDPPAKATPFVTQLKEGAMPFRCKARRYSAEQSEFMRNFTDLLIQYGLVYENYNAKWASPVVVVSKAGGNGFRMCVDLRAVNALCNPSAWPMPFLESIVNDLAGSKFWFSLDAFKGFWMMPLAEECQEMFSFMTDRGVFTPTRSIQGALNSATQFQARMYEMYKELLHHSLIIWIDDLLGHAATEEKWFSILSRTLELAEQYDLKLNLEKCNLFLQEAKFCGRIFTPGGVKHDPDRITALTGIPQPRTARDLQQFMMAVQWMSRSIPEYNTLIEPLQRIYELAMKDQPKRTRTVARGINLLKHGWSSTHALSFERMKVGVANSVQLSYPRQDMIQCVFVDANDFNSSGCVTQIPLEDQEAEITRARHEPLGFVGHRFSGSQLNWSTPEQEAFAIKDVLAKLDYLLRMKRPFRLYTDHKNLVSMFSPSNVTRQTAQKLQRWAMELMEFRYVIFHIAGEDNVWADLMTRWGAPDGAVEPHVTRTVRVRRVQSEERALEEQTRVRPLQNPGFIWPTLQEICEAQEMHLPSQTKSTCQTNEDGLFITNRGQVIVPDEAASLRIRLCVIAHAGGNSGHIGYQACYHALSEWCTWKTMQRDLERLCKRCLHCLPTRGGIRIPRPLGTACHGTRPNQVLHFDYLYIGPRKEKSEHDFEWALMIRDDLSGFVRVYPCRIPDAGITVDALLDWRSAYGTSEMYVSDQASYFVSTVMKQLAARCNVAQHWTTAYSHYPNGSIEVINRMFLALMRALMSELRVDKDQWPSLVKLVEHTLNHRLQKRLGWLAPVTVMTGLKADNPVHGIFRNRKDGSIAGKAMETASIVEHVSRLHESLALMHKEVVSLSEKERTRHRTRQGRRRAPNFGAGDYVLVGIPEPRAGQKLYLKWRGPYRIMHSARGYVFTVEDLVSGDQKEVHGDRVRFYDDRFLHVTEEMKYQLTHDNSSFEVDELRNVRLNPQTDELELLVKWRGFSEAENTWEPLHGLWEDVPTLVARYATGAQDTRLQALMRQHMEDFPKDKKPRKQQPRAVRRAK